MKGFHHQERRSLFQGLNLPCHLDKFSFYREKEKLQGVRTQDFVRAFVNFWKSLVQSKLLKMANGGRVFFIMFLKDETFWDTQF